MPLYGAVPPEAVTVTLVEPLAHAIVPAEAVAVTAEGCVTVVEQKALQPVPSVTVTE